MMMLGGWSWAGSFFSDKRSMAYRPVMTKQATWLNTTLEIWVYIARHILIANA